MTSQQKEIERIMNERDKHKGEWITEEAVSFYREKARQCLDANGQDVGERRQLRKEFQERFGLLEIEAINILNGFHVAFYVEKYRRIKNCLPWQNDSSKSTQEREE